MKLLLQLFAFFFILQTTCCSAAFEYAPVECKINTVGGSKFAYILTVSKSGGANFTTLRDAIDHIPADNDIWVKIALSPGTYKEQVQILGKQCVFLEGQDRTTTIIVFDAHADTAKSITFDAFTANFVARGVTFKNSYNLPDGDAAKNTTPAVAFRAYGDKQAFFSCGFEGYQDTLWDGSGRHYYDSCYIEGAVDFIWGEGESVFEKCIINVVGDGYITAQGKATANDSSGFVFRGCTVSGKGHTMLGRAYQAFAKVIFVASEFSNIIDPLGWFIWEQTGHEKDVTFAEVDCKGPGADMSKRVPWRRTFTASDLKSYTTEAFIDTDGWIKKLPL